MGSQKSDMGRTGFVERYGLWHAEDHEWAERALRLIEEHGVETVRLCFPDQHGLLRGKTIMAGGMAQAMRNGCSNTTTLFAKDTSHKTVFPVFSPGGGFGIPEMGNAGDVVMVPIPNTFRILPWSPTTGWVMCDVYLTNGSPVPFHTRNILKTALKTLADRGLGFIGGVEVECHIYRLLDPMLAPEHAGQPAEPPKVDLLAHGFHYLTELRMDEHAPVVEIIRRNLMALGLPLRTVEVEFGPSQVEMTLDPTGGLEAADHIVLFRNAVKQICRRNGYHATFMCRPGLPNTFSSGLHLHQSLVYAASGRNAFAPDQEGHLLSPLGLQYVAGLLANAAPAALFTTPTINGYKRYQSNSLAPDRAVWGKDNKGAMVRVVGSGAGDPATHLENRIGEPAANPYLYLASQIVSGLDGIDRGLTPPPATDDPYAENVEMLPASLMEAISALEHSALFRAAFGRQFIDYILHIKRAEVARFLSTVTDWEHREYFEMY